MNMSNIMTSYDFEKYKALYIDDVALQVLQDSIYNDVFAHLCVGSCCNVYGLLRRHIIRALECYDRLTFFDRSDHYDKLKESIESIGSIGAFKQSFIELLEEYGFNYLIAEYETYLFFEDLDLLINEAKAKKHRDKVLSKLNKGIASTADKEVLYWLEQAKDNIAKLKRFKYVDFFKLLFKQENKKVPKEVLDTLLKAMLEI